MSEEGLEFLRSATLRAAEAARGGDYAAIADLYDPDVEVRDLRHPPDLPEVTRGREAMFESWRRWADLFDDWSFVVEQLVDADPWIVCDIRWEATGKGSDVPVEWHVADAYEVRGGRIVRAIHNYADVETALGAVPDDRYT